MTRSFPLARVSAVALVMLARPPAWASEPAYDISVILEQTGAGAFIANSERHGIELAAKVINEKGGIGGRPLHFTFHDSQSSPQVSVQLANEVIATRPAVVLAATLVADCSAMAPLFKNGPVLYCFTPSFHPPAGSYFYSADISTRDLATVGMRYLRLRGLTRIAIMTSTDATGQDADRNFKDIAAMPENKELKIVEHAHFNTNDVSVAAQVERIKAADPQVLIVWTTGSPLATVLRAVQQAGLDIPIATSAGNEVQTQMIQFAAFLPKEIYFFTSPWPAEGDARVQMDPETRKAQQEFYEIFKAAGLEPDQGAHEGWEPAMVVAEALRKLGPGASAAQLQDHLQHLKGFMGVSGVYDFERTPQRGLTIDNAMVTRWDAAAKRWVAVSQLGGKPIDH